MTIESISAIHFDSPIVNSIQSDRVSFIDILAEEMAGINQTIRQAEDQTKAYAVGESDNIHQLMISLSKAKTQFELAVQVRNRLLEGMQEIMRMSV